MTFLTLSFPDRLALARKRKNLTQEGLAQRLDLKSGKQAVYNWESGRGDPTLSNLIKMATILEVSVGWLVDGEIQVVENQPEVAPGYMIIKMDEVLTMQRELLQYRERFGALPQ